MIRIESNIYNVGFGIVVLRLIVPNIIFIYINIVYRYEISKYIITGRKNMEYPVGYTISSDIVLGYSISRRDSKFISFKRYKIKFKTEYSTE